ncbi:hypothetical protein AMTR_s00122p00075980 [Amborella trichopoda]|uniref:Uncharacterized protein n=1 Tax=Amborella trichopoda TaxID=13333 RepID=W1NMC8_AMBTC|nr:hypothetical protein AMTR_s00122p00075980 [Amborella trichopoda]
MVSRRRFRDDKLCVICLVGFTEKINSVLVSRNVSIRWCHGEDLEMIRWTHGEDLEMINSVCFRDDKLCVFRFDGVMEKMFRFHGIMEKI